MTRKLHIGARYSYPGWEVLGAVPDPHVDHLGNAKDLSRFDDHTFEAIYASHVLEHFDYEDELSGVLKEWFRVLLPGGKLYVSVPDMDVLAKLFIDKEKLSFDDRFYIMRIMFGGHVDEYDYHLTGLNREFLDFFLRQAGYINIQQKDDFGLFQDSSTTIYKEIPISINLIAERPS